MSVICPNCKSKSVITKDAAKKTCAVVGALAGAASGVASVISSAEIGGTVGLIVRPAGSAVGSLAGAIIGGLIAGTSGCIAGIKLGTVIDERILNNFHCLECHFEFSSQIDGLTS